MELALERPNLKAALKRARKSKGGPGIDGMRTEDLLPYLWRNWDAIRGKLLAGTYQPFPVKRHQIPKGDGGMRELGIPTVLDRFIQQALLQVLQPGFDASFSKHSYGFRPKRSAHDVVRAAKRYVEEGRRVVVDVDLEKFFDSLDHALVERAVAHHTDISWARLYISRWLRAPVQMPDGTLEPRTKGTPQGGVISPLLANLFLHYAFDVWMRRNFPWCPFERYADDVAIHSRSKAEAQTVVEAIRGRLAQCHLELHPIKTRIVYCKDDDRPGEHEHVSFCQGDPQDHPRVAYGVHPEQSRA